PGQRQALARLEAASLVVDLPPAGKAFTSLWAEVRLDFPDKKSALAGQRAAAALLKDILGRIDNPGGVAPEAGDFVASLMGPLRAATLQQQGNKVRLGVRFRWHPGDLARWQARVRDSAHRAQSALNLRRIGLAMATHHSAYGHLPPAVI